MSNVRKTPRCGRYFPFEFHSSVGESFSVRFHLARRRVAVPLVFPFSQQLGSIVSVIAYPPRIDPLAYAATLVYQKCQLLGILVCDPRLPHCGNLTYVTTARNMRAYAWAFGTSSKYFETLMWICCVIYVYGSVSKCCQNYYSRISKKNWWTPTEQIDPIESI